MNADDLANRFTFHPASPEQAQSYTEIRSLAFDLAKRLDELCPDSRELSLALTHLEDAVFWANAAIARHPESASVGRT
jgi:hypothetical protein